MMTKEELRRADFVTSILLFGFGTFILSQAFQMPMRDTFGGVQNVWYVSPALMPLTIGVAITVLSLVLLGHSIRTGGAVAMIARLRNNQFGFSDSQYRFGAILLALFSFVYLFVPRTDFYLSTAIFLTYFITAFYFDTREALRALTRLYGGMVAFFTILAISGLGARLNALFAYAVDVLVLAALIWLGIAAHRLARGAELTRKRYRIALTTALLTPLLLAVAFRYFLMVPMPREGGIIQLMNLVYYTLR